MRYACLPVSNPIDLQRLLLDQNRFVVAQIRTKDGNIGFTLSAERLHNISGTYSGKDDPVVLALCQGDWPAPVRSPRCTCARSWSPATAAARTACTSDLSR